MKNSQVINKIEYALNAEKPDISVLDKAKKAAESEARKPFEAKRKARWIAAAASSCAVVIISVVLCLLLLPIYHSPADDIFKRSNMEEIGVTSIKAYSAENNLKLLYLEAEAQSVSAYKSKHAHGFLYITEKYTIDSREIAFTVINDAYLKIEGVSDIEIKYDKSARIAAYNIKVDYIVSENAVKASFIYENRKYLVEYNSANESDFAALLNNYLKISA